MRGASARRSAEAAVPYSRSTQAARPREVADAARRRDKSSDRMSVAASERAQRCKFDNSVEVGGVEPPSSKFLAGLLRAQPMLCRQAVTGHRHPVTTPSSFGVLTGPEVLHR